MNPVGADWIKTTLEKYYIVKRLELWLHH
jgi:hypothetical protein